MKISVGQIFPMRGQVMCGRGALGLMLGLVLACLLGCETIVNSIQGEPIREIYPGQVLSSQLSKERHSRVKVVTTSVLGPPSTIYQTDSKTEVGRGYVKTTTTTKTATVRNSTLRNDYSREESLSGTTEVWKINAMFLSEPTEVVLQIEGAGFTPQAVLFEGVTERQASAGSKPGIYLPPYEGRANLVAGVALLDPQKTYYLAVQAVGEPVSASYVVGLFLNQ